MFNRVIEMKLVKKNNTPPPTPVSEQIEDVVLDAIYIAKESTKDLINYTAKMAVGYILLDTLRKVAIEMATKPK